MRLKRIRLAAALAAGLIAGTVLTGVALATGYDTSNCTAANLRFVVDGVAQRPHAPGTLPPVLICGGTSYVPTRFMAAALGRTVTWDATARTVTIAPSAASGQTCVLKVDVNVDANGAAAGSVTATYGEISRVLTKPHQSLDLPCGRSVVLTEQPVDASLPFFSGWGVQTADGDTTSTASTLEIRLIGETTVVQANYAAVASPGGQ